MSRLTDVNRRFCVAPMMDWTDRHCRYFMRLLTKQTLLYTEMVTAAALTHGDPDRLLAFDPAEHPVALQIGGSDPAMLARAAALGEQAGYLEINLNVGCPSNRVQSGRFGACLMAEPDLVAECVSAMCDSVAVPVTVKTRVGIDELDSDEFLGRFVATVAEVGCRTFIIHARKAWLTGLSPKQNREIPSLNYARVHRLKRERPDLEIIINGGLKSLEDLSKQLEFVDGAMMGRAAYQDPYLLTQIDSVLFGESADMPKREDIVREMHPYIARQLEAGTPVARVTRHMLGLFAGQPGARAWRRYISEHAHQDGAGTEVLIAALESMRAAA